jgi:hypothetical protein
MRDDTVPLLLAVALAVGALFANTTPAEGAQLRRIRRLPGLARRLNWIAKYYAGARWDTTRDAADLDNEVRLGAKILKYRNGSYVRTIHKQYPQVCGAAALAMVLKQLGISGAPAPARRALVLRRRLHMPQDVDREGRATVDVGYGGSMEHVMWLGYHRRRLDVDGNSWNNGRTDFMSSDGVLVTANTRHNKRAFDGRKLDYLSCAQIPSWMWNGAAVGYLHGRDYYTGLPGIMNYIFSGGRNGPWRDAMPLSMSGRTDADVVAYRRIIRAFIDTNISVVCSVEGSNHFNALIGYRGSVSPAASPFYIYTADPLDGWGRSEDRQPLTWRRMKLVRDNLGSGKKLITSIICWNHHAAGGASVAFRRSGWATVVDRQNRNSWLTGPERRPHERDPLNDPLARRAERMP